MFVASDMSYWWVHLCIKVLQTLPLEVAVEILVQARLHRFICTSSHHNQCVVIPPNKTDNWSHPLPQPLLCLSLMPPQTPLSPPTSSSRRWSWTKAPSWWCPSLDRNCWPTVSMALLLWSWRRGWRLARARWSCVGRSSLHWAPRTGL